MSLQNINSTNERAAQKLLDEDRHYVVAVTRMGDDRTVVASADIIGARGIKLLAKGSRIDSSVLDKLLGHRLREPIDRNLMVDSGVSPNVLAMAVAAVIDAEPWWARLANRSGDALGMRHGMSRLKIPQNICFMLTVAREQRPALYRHSLRTALLSHYLALRLELSAADTESLLLAALCHDLGELHTDPALLDAGHRISDQERRFVYAHPVTGYLILKQVSTLRPEVARAVLQHHERLDGSGYPSGLRDAAISSLARILAVTELAESLLARFADQRRLGTLLRLNQSKYDGAAVSMLLDALTTGQELSLEDAELAPGILNRQLSEVSHLLSGWNGFSRTLGQTASGDGQVGLDFLFERIGNINSVLHQFGFDPDSFEMLAHLAQEDPEIAAELKAVLHEMTFQLTDMAREIARREFAEELRLPASARAAFADWKAALVASVAAS